MPRVYNFSAGPSMLPLPVLERAAAEMTDYHGSGMSVAEMSHRSPIYESIIHEAEATLRRVLSIPDNYKVLFMQGGATLQFAAVPMNLIGKTGKADYVISGQFSNKAYKEATKYGDIRVVASSAEENFTYVPYITRADIRDDASYVHICYNNTIYGTRYNYILDTGDIPLVADMSSYILSESLDVTKFGLIYACAQKNMGPAGVTVVIVREDLLGGALPFAPSLLDYKITADNDSMYNTPPCYSIYMMGLVLKWIEETGGLAAMKERNERKAKILYDYLDSQDYYIAPAKPEFRSMMNVTFVTGSADLDKKFASEAEKAGLVNLKGHRSVGGMRASIYNAMPEEGIVKLVEFMMKFAKSNKK